MGTEGRAFHLEADDIVRVENEKDPQEEDQEETNAPTSNQNSNQNHVNSMYPTLDDASTIRASNDTDSRQAQHTNLTRIVPSSTTSATGISTTTLKKRLRAEDLSLIHISEPTRP